MGAHPAPATMTVEEYLALEQTSQVKHEYSHGRVYAMSGCTVAHDRIANNVQTALDNHIGDGSCMVLGPDVRLQVSETIYYYPDTVGTSEDSRQ